MTYTNNFSGNEKEALLANLERDTGSALSAKAKATFDRNYDLINAILYDYENYDGFVHIGLEVLWNIVPPGPQFCNHEPVATVVVRALPDEEELPFPIAIAWPSVVCTDDCLLITTATEDEASSWAERMLDRCDLMLEWAAPFLKSQAYAAAIGQTEAVHPVNLLVDGRADHGDSLPWACWTKYPGRVKAWRQLSRSCIEATCKMYEQRIDAQVQTLALEALSHMVQKRPIRLSKVKGFPACIVGGVGIKVDRAGCTVDFGATPHIRQDFYRQFSIRLGWNSVTAAVGASFEAFSISKTLHSCSDAEALRYAAALSKASVPHVDDSGDYSDVLSMVAQDMTPM